MTVPATPIVGRKAELDTMLGLLQHSADGTAGAILLAGDAGVGKTRLLIETSVRATDEGWLTLVGHCVDFGDAGLPYLPISEAFGSLVRDHSELGRRLVEEFPQLSRLLPASRRAVAQAAAFDDRVDRGDLFDAVLGALELAAAERPVLLIVEDLHWADQATRDLLGFLLTRLRTQQRLAIVASYRAEDLHRRHPLRAAAAEWARLPGVARLTVPPLAAADVRTLIADLRGQPLPEHTVRGIIERSGGNAFFAEQLLATAQDDGPPVLPAELADLLLVRLDRLSPEARQVIRAAAVAGRRVPHELLASVVEVVPDQLDSALREAIDAHLLEPVGTQGYGFRHALLAEAVYSDLLPGERIRLHASYAGAPSLASTGSAAELARHARESHDFTTAFSAGVRAGDEAMTVAAADDAMRHYEGALEVAANAPPEYAYPATTVGTKAADAASVAGHVFRALALVKAAVAGLPADAPAAVRAEFLLAQARYSLPVDSETDIVTVTAEALRLVPAEPPTALRARIAVMHARGMSSLARDADVSRWAQEAVTVADLVGDSEAAADGRTTLAMLDHRAGDPTGAAAALREVREQAAREGHLTSELRSGYSLGSLYSHAGDLVTAAVEFQSTVRRAQAAGAPWSSFGIESRVLLAITRYQLGEWDQSLADCESVEAPSPPAEAMLAATSLLAHAGRGNVDALNLVPDLRSWSRRETVVAAQLSAAAELLAYDGRRDEALALFDDVVRDLTDLWQTPAVPAQLRISALALDVLAQSAQHLPQSGRGALVERGGGFVHAARGVAESERRARRLGAESAAWALRVEAEWNRLRWLAGIDAPELDDHILSWQAAVDGFGYGDQYEQARSRTRLAAVLRLAGRGPEAVVLADAARVVARELGAVPLLAELRALGTERRPPAVAATGLAALTDREREVLGLLEQGRTNRLIAKELYISEKTVSVHVSNILAKLGASGRAEAAAIARRGHPEPL